MAQIYIQRDPSAINDIERYEISHQVSLLDWLNENEEANFGGLHAQITLNDKTHLYVRDCVLTYTNTKYFTKNAVITLVFVV